MERLIQICFFKHFFKYRNASCIYRKYITYRTKCIMPFGILFISMLYLTTSFVYTVQLHTLRPFAIDIMLWPFTYK